MKKKWKSEKLETITQELTVQMNRTTDLTVKGKALTIRPIRIAVMLLAGLLALILLVQILLIPVRRPRTVEMDLGTGGDYAMLPMDSNIVMYNRQEIREITTRGSVKWTDKLAMSSPMAESKGKYILLCDLGGNRRTVLYKNGEKQVDTAMENDIITAEVNRDGLWAVATATVGYKGKVIVYDKKGKERFSWNSGEGYILDVALNESGRYLAVAQLSSEGSRTDSRIQFIDLQRKKVTATAERNGSVISEIRFSGNRLLAVSQSELCGFKTSGKLSFAVSFAGKNPKNYDISGDDVLAFVTTDSRGNAVLELYNSNGKLKGSYLADSTINNLTVYGDRIAISKQRDILYINHRGKLKKSVTAENDINGLGLYGDGHTALAVGDTSVFIARMR